jgi:hypothetical protein
VLRYKELWPSSPLLKVNDSNEANESATNQHSPQWNPNIHVGVWKNFEALGLIDVESYVTFVWSISLATAQC